MWNRRIKCQIFIQQRVNIHKSSQTEESLMPAKIAVIRKRKKCQMLMKMCKNYLFFYAVGKNANKTAVKRNGVDI